MLTPSDDIRSPGQTASRLGRYARCNSAFIREWEVWTFAEAHKLPQTVFASGQAAQAGRELHKLLALVPLYIPAISLGQPITIRAVEALAVQHGIPLASGEAWVVAEMIKRRDAVIADTYADAVAHAAACGDRIIGIEDVRDTERFSVRWQDDQGRPHEFSGQPDVWVEVIGSNGVVMACVLDFKTGRGQSVGGAADNTQLAALATLGMATCQANNADRRLHAVRGALIERATLDQPQVTVFYPAEVLSRNLSVIQDHVEEQDDLLARWRAASDATGDPTPEFSAMLDARARIGSQCTHCAGAIACGKRREWMVEKTAAAKVSTEEEARLAQVLTQVKREQGELSGKPSEYFTEPMNEKTLKATHEAAKAMLEGVSVAESIHQATTEIIRHRLQKDAAAVPGYGLKQGARYLALNPERVTTMGDGETRIAQADLTPAGLFASLASVLPGVDQERFVAEACEVVPGRVTELLAQVHGLPKERVMERILAPLGGLNPIIQLNRAPSVVAAEEVESELKAIEPTATEKAGESARSGR